MKRNKYVRPEAKEVVLFLNSQILESSNTNINVDDDEVDVEDMESRKKIWKEDAWLKKLWVK